MKVAYARVSTIYQNLERQIESLEKFGAEKIFVEKKSGATIEQRLVFQEALNFVREEDTFMVEAIDRLGRNYDEILEQWRILTKEKGVDIVVLDMPLLDTRRGKDLMGTFLSDIVLQVLSFAAENERKNIRQRQAEGIAAAKARGVRFGRPQINMPEYFGKTVRSWERKEITVEEAVRRCGVSESTFYRRLREYRAERRVKKNQLSDSVPSDS